MSESPSPKEQSPLALATELASRAPEPALVDNVVSGTAGWTDPTLLKSGLFYPKTAKSAQQRLEHYARHFQMVEVDATYYTLLAERTTRTWCQWTPPGFVFHIKAHPVFTGHPIDLGRLPKDLAAVLSDAGYERRVYPNRLPSEVREELENRFFSSIAPLADTGRLGRVLLQFPPWFTATRGNVRRIEALRERFQEPKFAVEFRHKSWLEGDRRGRVFDLLTRLEMSYVCVDEPAGPVGGVPPVVTATTPELAMVRFHGQNAAGWRKKGASVQERFDYLYDEAELTRWVEPVRRLSSQAKSVHAVFNNCVQNYAVLNAKGLVVLLQTLQKG